ncbi:MAG TPA: diguanylate cyclase [Polyangiales bacterium]|nr:diguanylate cyclase [Polyangiales bacterium]
MTAANIFVVDDDPNSIADIASTLEDCGHVSSATSGSEALRVLRRHVPDLILLSLDLTEPSGFELCAELKQIDAVAGVPIIFLTTRDSAADEITGLELGAADFIAKPLRPHLLRARVKLQLRVQNLTVALRESDALDPLTGLATREHFQRELEAECARAARAGSPIAVLRIAVDQLSTYAVVHGAAMAEHALRALSSVMRGSMQRSSDMLARFDTSEFAAILPDTDGAGAMLVAHNVIAAVDTQGVQHQRSPIAGHVTASVGVTVYAAPRARRSVVNARATSAHAFQPVATDLIAASGRAVMSAKRAGGHCVCFVAVEGVAKPAPAQILTAGMNGE